jgi:formate-dependent phosphoribosylglycinamide formyltransferase (GAR transformylase)
MHTLENVSAKNMDIKNNKILILGASTWHIPWLKKAKALGFIVYATDWSKTAEGKDVPHHFSPIDLRDKEATLAYAQKHQVGAIFTSAEIGVQTAAYVAAKMGLHYHSEKLAFCATNKFAMREKAQMIGIDIPGYQLASTLAGTLIAAGQIGFPLIIKPVDNFSSKGIYVINNQDELEKAFFKSIACSFDGKVLIEEFMTGTEGSVEALIKNGVPYIMGISKKQKSSLPYRYDLLLEYPGDYSPAQLALIKQFVNKLVSGFEIKNGIIHIEIMVKQLEIKLIEFAIRGCGSKVVTHLMPALTNYDVMAYALWNAFGIQKPILFSTKNYGVLKFIMLPKGKIKHITGKETIRKLPGILDFDIERKSGDLIEEIEDGRNRPGYLLAYSENKKELNMIVKHALTALKLEYQ